MEAHLCRIYLHDLNLKQQAKARKYLISMAADNATAIRFVQDLNQADFWVLDQNSSFMDYARKKKASGHICLFTFSDEQLLDDQCQILSPIDAYRLIKQTAQHIAEKSQSKKTADIANLIRKGMLEKQGQLCVAYKDALFLFDFASLQARYNNAAYNMLLSDMPMPTRLNELTLVTQTPSTELKRSASAFSIIWLMTHRLRDLSTDKLFNQRTTLKLDSWPPFEQVKHQFDDYRMASLLQKRPLSIEQVCQLLGLDKLSVSMFYHAIFLSATGHIIDTETIPSLPQPHKTAMLSSLWRKVRDVVGV